MSYVQIPPAYYAHMQPGTPYHPGGQGWLHRGTLTPAVEDMFNDQLDELWNELTVAEVREVEERYTELKVRKFG